MPAGGRLEQHCGRWSRVFTKPHSIASPDGTACPRAERPPCSALDSQCFAVGSALLTPADYSCSAGEGSLACGGRALAEAPWPQSTYSCPYCGSQVLGGHLLHRDSPSQARAAPAHSEVFKEVPFVSPCIHLAWVLSSGLKASPVIFPGVPHSCCPPPSAVPPRVLLCPIKMLKLP